MAHAKNTKQGNLPISGAQFLIVITLVIGIYFAVDLSRQAMAVRRLGVWEQELAADVSRLEAEVDGLQGQLDEVQTDAYAERVAREEFGWGRPGDVLVVPLFTEPPLKAAPEATATPK